MENKNPLETFLLIVLCILLAPLIAAFFMAGAAKTEG